MSEEERFICPKCEMPVSKDDKFCKNCGTRLRESSETAPQTPPPPEHIPEEIHERKFSLASRFYKLVRVPSEAMMDIALAPDYGGFFVIVAIEVVLSSVSIALALQKIQLSGPHAQTISNMLSGIMALAVFIASLLFIAKWLAKSLIVKYGCDSGSNWSFKSAASVTGYAYIVDIIISIVGICILWFIIPTFSIDTTNLTTSIQVMNDYRAQINWLNLVYRLPVSILGLLWKSYLGGSGTHFGTKKRCSLGMGFAVFFALGLIGLLISYFIA